MVWFVPYSAWNASVGNSFTTTKEEMVFGSLLPNKLTLRVNVLCLILSFPFSGSPCIYMNSTDLYLNEGRRGWGNKDVKRFHREGHNFRNRWCFSKMLLSVTNTQYWCNETIFLKDNLLKLKFYWTVLLFWWDVVEGHLSNFGLPVYK